MFLIIYIYRLWIHNTNFICTIFFYFLKVDELKISLAEQETALAQKKEKTEELIKIIEKETVKTKREKTLGKIYLIVGNVPLLNHEN